MTQHTRFLALEKQLHIYFPESEAAIEMLTCLRDFHFLERVYTQSWSFECTHPALPSNALGVMSFTSDIERVKLLNGHSFLKLERAFSSALGANARLTQFLKDIEHNAKLIKSGR